jgi:NitT/TauT family transport system permease protein
MRRKRPFLLRRLPLGILGVLAALGLWQLVGSRTNPVLLATPTSVARAFPTVINQYDLWGAYWVTMSVFFAMLAVGTVAGVIIGLLTASNRSARYVSDPVVAGIYAIPVVALIPVLVLWFGVGTTPIAAIVILAVIFPVIINTQLGVDSISEHFHELGQSLGANRREMLRGIVAPAIIPFVLTGLRIATPRGLVAIIAGELLISETGLGGLAYKFGTLYQTARYFVPIVLLVATSLVLSEVLRIVERKLTPWQVKES